MKKFICCVLVLSALLSLCACAKGKPSADEDETSGVVMINKAEKLYPLKAGVAINHVARCGDTLIMSAVSGEDSILGVSEILEDGTISEASRIEIAAQIIGICAGGTCFYILTVEESTYSVLKISTAGELLSEAKIADLRPEYLLGITAFEDTLATYDDEHIYIFDESGNLTVTHDFEEDGIVYSVSSCAGGLVACVFSYNAAGCEYFLADGKGDNLAQIGLPLENTSVFFDGNIAATQGLGGDYTAYNGMIYCAWNIETGKSGELYRWASAPIEGAITSLCRLSENSFVYAVNGCEYLTKISKVPKQYREQELVKVAIFPKRDYTSYLTAHLDNINATDGKYLYEYEVYDAGNLDLLTVKLGTSDAPDLLWFDSNSLAGSGIYFSTDSDLFEDLYTYIDADKDLSRDSFLPNLLESISVGGKLSQMWKYINIITIAARRSDLGDATKITPDVYREAFEKGEYPSYFPEYMPNELLVGVLSIFAIGEYADRDTGVCHFDDPSFADLLAWCKEASGHRNELPPDYEFGDLRDYMLLYFNVGSPNQVHLSTSYGGEMVLSGFPTGDYSGSYYECADYRFAIPALASEKQGAWELIKNEIMFEEQISPEQGFPVNADAYRHMASVLPDADYEMQENLLKSTTVAVSDADQPLSELILAECMKYLNDAATLEDTVHAIQTRASIYMSEQYG